MNSENQKQSVQPVGQPYMMQQPWYPPEDEISLVDLWRVLVKQKRVIVATFSVVTIVALLYALLASPLYRAETHFLPPLASDIQALNVQGVQGVQDITVDTVYSAYKQSLGSRELQRSFFDREVKALLAEGKEAVVSDEQLFEGFLTKMKVSGDKKDKSKLSLAVEWDDAETAAMVANRYSELASRETIRQLLSNLRNAVDNRIRDIEYDIASKRKIAQQRREDRIAKLEEADQIKRIKIEEQIVLLKEYATIGRKDRITVLQENLMIADQLGMDKVALSSSFPNQSQVEINTAATPLYMYGSERLKAEIEALSHRSSDVPFVNQLRDLEKQLKSLQSNSEILILKQRTNDDPFITGLRDLQEELTRLRSITWDEQKLQAVRFDQKAYPPEQRIKPKRKLIVVLGAVLGLMLGIFLAFFLNFIENQRKEEESLA